MKRPTVAPLDEETAQRLRETGGATLATVLYRHGFRSRVVRSAQRLRPGGARMVGVARTLRYVAMREDLDTLEAWKRPENPQRRIADEIAAGEVLVIEAREDASCGTMGGMLVARMLLRGAAGIVSDGPFRDGPFIAGLDLPSYANGMNANTNLVAHHPEDLDLTITCGGVQVRPGDVVVGDDEGVVVIPRAIVEQVAREAHAKELEEAWIERQILAGHPVEGTYPMSAATRRRYEVESEASG
ncbi:MAG: ribonuclease activity regulator RraA [Trueperaceae bacterium]